MLNATLLTEYELWGENKLDIFTKHGTRASATDVAIALDTYISSDVYTDEGKSLANRSCQYCTQSSFDDLNGISIVSTLGRELWNEPYSIDIGVRPVFKFSNIEEISQRKEITPSDYLIADQLNFPTKIIDIYTTIELNQQKKIGGLQKTGKTYTLPDSNRNSFQVVEEVLYEGKKYAEIKVIVRQKMVSTGEQIRSGDKVWAEVTPLEGEVVGNKFICKQVLFPMKFDDVTNCYEDSSLKDFLENTFLKEVTASPKLESGIQQNRASQNAYHFEMDSPDEMETIKSYIESDIPVFLHGLSGDGKSGRIKQLDPDCEIVTISTKTPELLIGTGIKNNDTKSVEYLPPPWYVSLCKKCEREPERLHILFLDELTNTKNNDSIQKYAYSIALDRIVNDRFPLPKNARVVAAGNEKEDSKIASSLAVPLHGRFAHVYIKTTVESWLLWATANQIHPAICAYIACRGEEVLHTKFTEKEPNANPRKWEMASKVLYKTGKPKLLNGLVGEKITNEFCAFCAEPILTIEDVLAGEYKEESLSEMPFDRQATEAAVLSTVDEEHMEELNTRAPLVKRIGRKS